MSGIPTSVTIASAASSAAASQDEWRSHWRTLLGASMALAVGVGLWNVSAGFFLKPLAAHFGWSRGTIAAAPIFGLLAALIMPFAGSLVDRFGVRRVGFAGLSAYGLCFFALASMRGGLLVFYSLSALLAAISPLTSSVVFTRPVVGTFLRRRGSALGLAMTGPPIFAMAFLPLLQLAIAGAGWRAGYVLLGLAAIVVGLPAIGVLIKTDRTLEKPQQERAGARQHFTVALTDHRFWIIVLAAFIGNVAVGGILQHSQALLTDRGFAGVTAAALGSLAAAAVLVGRFVTGVSLDRLWRPGVAFCVFALPAIGALMLLFGRPTLPVAGVGVALQGFAQGAETDLLAYLVAQTFGLSMYGRVFALVGASAALSLGLGAFGFGVLYDAFHSYDRALLFAALLYLAAAIMVFLAARASDRVASNRIVLNP